MGSIQWSNVGNVIGTALTVAFGAFTASQQFGSSNEEAATQAGYAFVVSIVQHFRGRLAMTTPTGPQPLPVPPPPKP